MKPVVRAWVICPNVVNHGKPNDIHRPQNHHKLFGFKPSPNGRFITGFTALISIIPKTMVCVGDLVYVDYIGLPH